MKNLSLRTSLRSRTLVGASLVTLTLAACSGSDEVADDTPDAGADVSGGDTSFDGGSDAGTDAAPDVQTDATLDAQTDATPDVQPDVVPDVAPDVVEGPLPILGEFNDQFGGSHWITDGTWQQGWGPNALIFRLRGWSIEEEWALAENDSGNAFNPGLWSRFDWTEQNGSFWFCQTVFDAESMEAAMAADRADDADLEAGCGGFSWSQLIPGSLEPAISGVYTDDFGGAHWLNDLFWQMGWGPTASTFAVDAWSNPEQWIVAQNDRENAFNPELWSRFDWHWDEAGDLFFCQTVFDGADEASARDATPADAEDLEAGCGGFSWSQLTPGEGPIAIQGVFVDDFGGSHWVQDGLWQMGWGPTASLFFIEEVSNTRQYAVAQNGPENSFNPDLYSRFDWHWDDDAQLYYCQTVFDAATAEEAAAATPADSDDLDAGCGGFSWSQLTVGEGDLSITEVYVDNFDGSHWVQQDVWQMGWGPAASLFFMDAFSNSEQYIIAQNGPDNGFNPDLWSRFDWTWDDAGDLYYCQSTFNADTAEDARAAVPGDSGDLEAGCGGFPWSQLTPGEGTIAIVGTWSTLGGERLTITDTDWTTEIVDSGTFVSTFIEVSNTGRYVIGEEDGFGFDRHEWTWDIEGNLYYCKLAFRLPSIEDVEAEPFADPTNPALGGCAGGPWTALIAD